MAAENHPLMELGDINPTVKVLVVGNGGVGKSTMTARYCKGVYTTTYKKTIGAAARACELARAQFLTRSPPPGPPQASTFWRRRSSSTPARPSSS